MGITYNPVDPTAEVTSIFGQTVEAGDSLDESLLSDAQKEKLKRHPDFQPEGRRGGAEAKQDEKLAKAQDKRVKAASEARAKAAKATDELAARERAEQQVQAIAESRAEEDPFPANESIE